MNVSVTISHDCGGTVTVEAEHDSEAFSPDVLDSLLAHCAARAEYLASLPALTGDED